MIVVGVDSRNARLSLGDCTGRTAFYPLEGSAEGRGAQDTYLRASLAMHEFTAGRDVLAVFVEMPRGHVADSLWITIGAITAGVYVGVNAGRGKDTVSVFPLPPSQWKKATVGNGNASKAMVMAWVLAQGFEVDGQDEADAIGIAVGGKSLISTVTT